MEEMEEAGRQKETRKFYRKVNINRKVTNQEQGCVRIRREIP